MTQISNHAGIFDFKGRELERQAAADVREMQAQLRQEMDFVKDKLQISSNEIGTTPKKDLESVKTVVIQSETAPKQTPEEKYVVGVNKNDGKIEDVVHYKDVPLKLDGSTLVSSRISHVKPEEGSNEYQFAFNRTVEVCGTPAFNSTLYFKDPALTEPYKYENNVTGRTYFLE
ncbi:MAG: hypothetical protein LWY06_20040 [Firmicutes bacterium]|nr:hypothetical protein [Bacillota bacterium]